MIKVVSISILSLLLTITFSTSSTAQTPIWELKVEGGIVSTALADLDGDDTLDAVVVSDRGDLYGVNGSSGEILWSFSAEGGTLSPPALADLNSDGIWDVLGGTSQGTIYVLDGPSGNKLFDFKVGEGPISYVAAGDLNGDEVIEFLTVDSEGGIKLLERSGKMLWEVKMESPLATPPYLADFNRDLRPDLVVGLDDGSVHVLGGSKGSKQWSLKTGAGRASILTVGDVGGDGVPDVLAASGNTLFLIAGASGEKLWEVKTPSPITSATRGTMKNRETPVILLTSAESIRALDGIGGQEIWNLVPKEGVAWVEIKPGEERKSQSVLASSPNGVLYELTEGGRLLGSHSLSQTFSIPILVGDLDRSGRLSVVSANKDSLHRYRTDISIESGRVLRGRSSASGPDMTLDYYAPAGAFAGRTSSETATPSQTSILAEEHYAKGQAFIGNRRWTESIESFKKVSELDPEYKKEDIRTGMTVAEDRLKETKNLYDQAIRNFNRRRWRQAIDLFKQAASITPNHPDARGKIREAEGELEQAQAHYLAGLRFVEEGMTQDAVVQLRAALDLDPGHQEARRLLRSIGNLGTILLISLTAILGGGAAVYLALWIRGGDRRLERRIDRLEEELREDPSRTDVVTELSDLLLKVERYDDGAVAVYQGALEAGHNGDRLTGILSHIYLGQGLKDQASLDVYERSLMASPGDRELLKAVGNIYLDQEREDETALGVYERLNEVVEDEYLDKMLAYIYGKKEATDDGAMKVYARALGYNPNDLSLMSFMAQAHLIRGEPERAAEICRRALSLLSEEKEEKPSQSVETIMEACTRTADMYTADERLDEAIEILERASETFPDRQEIVDRLLRLYEGQFVRGVGGDQSNRLKLAKIYRKKGRVEEAINELVRLPLDDADIKIDYALEMGKCLLIKNDARSVIGLLEETLEGHKVNDQTEELYYDLALAYQQEGLEDKYNITLGKIMVYDLDYKDVVQRIGNSNRDSKGEEGEE